MSTYAHYDISEDMFASAPLGGHGYLDISIHDLTQCQSCHKHQSEGVVLQKCSACKIYMYCSKACQTKAWKATHKGECSDIDLPSLTPQGSGQLVVAAMRAFARKHMNVLTSIAMDAMDADNEPERGFRDSLVIRLKLRSEPTLVANMFQATEARIYSNRELGNQKSSREMVDHLKACVLQRRQSGGFGSRATHGINVILVSTDSRRVDIVPLIFSDAQIHLPHSFGPEYADLKWDQALLASLNGGATSQD